MRWNVVALALLPLLLLTGEGDAGDPEPGSPEATAEEAKAPEPCEPVSQSVQNVLNSLDQRERSITRREASVQAREADLRILEQQLTTRMEELSAIRTEVKSQLETLQTSQDTRVDEMVRMFNAMRPADAAPILAQTDTPLAVQVLIRMNAGKAGKVLGEMDAPVAARLSEAIARAPKVSQPKEAP